MCTGTGGPGEKKAGGLREAGEDARFSRWWEVGKIGKVTQHCTVFRNRQSAKRREPAKIGRKPGLKGT